jgi:hypothetical protein
MATYKLYLITYSMENEQNILGTKSNHLFQRFVLFCDFDIADLRHLLLHLEVQVELLRAPDSQ